MPWEDWQFWIVTAAALLGLWTLVRQILPQRGAKSPACGGCATGSAACARPAADASQPTS